MTTAEGASTELAGRDEHGLVDAAAPDISEVEVQLVTRRALILEAKAREARAYYNLAKSFSKTKMVKECYQWNGIEDPEHPKFDMGPVQNLAAAMMFGGKLGIDVEDAGLLVIMIKDQPSLEAKTMVALIRRWIDQRVAAGRTRPAVDGGDGIWEVEADDKHCVWAARRDGMEKSVEWNIARAERAGYTDDITLRSGGTKKSMYVTIPTEMLRARTQSEISRLMFSDVLRGLQYSAEELRMDELIERAVPVVHNRSGGKGMAALEQSFAGQPPLTVDGEIVADPPVGSPPEDIPLASAKDLSPVHITLGEAGITDREQKLVVLRKLADREIASSKELNVQEVADIMATFNRWKASKNLPEQLLALVQGKQAAPERATSTQLAKLRKTLREAGIETPQMLGWIGDVIGQQVTNINSLTEVDVLDCMKAATKKAEHAEG